MDRSESNPRLTTAGALPATTPARRTPPRHRAHRARLCRVALYRSCGHWIAPAMSAGHCLPPRRLLEVEIPSPNWGAAVLLAFVLGVSKAWLYAPVPAAHGAGDQPVREPRAQADVPRAGGLPGRVQPFYGLDITVDQRVLIPRPGAEMLVEQALAHARRMAQDGLRSVVADIGTSSEVRSRLRWPQCAGSRDLRHGRLARVHGGCRENVWRYGLGEQVHLLPGYAAGPPEPVDIIVANLPYVTTADLATLPVKVPISNPCWRWTAVRTAAWSCTSCMQWRRPGRRGQARRRCPAGIGGPGRCHEVRLSARPAGSSSRSWPTIRIRPDRHDQLHEGRRHDV